MGSLWPSINSMHLNILAPALMQADARPVSHSRCTLFVCVFVFWVFVFCILYFVFFIVEHICISTRLHSCRRMQISVTQMLIVCFCLYFVFCICICICMVEHIHILTQLHSCKRMQISVTQMHIVCFCLCAAHISLHLPFSSAASWWFAIQLYLY